jgi:hypothetical protein
MLRIVLLYGIAGGLILALPMIGWMVGHHGHDLYQGSVFYGYLVMLLALTAVFLGVKHYRDKVRGGVIGFGPALLVGLGISTLASLFYVAGWEISLAASGIDFARDYSRLMVDSARARHPSPAQLQEAIANAESFARMYSNPLYRIWLTFLEIFPVGVLVSLISAALLRFRQLLPARAAG